MRFIEAYRIDKSRYTSTALTGEGAKKFGGRWNHEGVAVLYCSSSMALAQLETLVHLDGATPPDGFGFLKLTFPASCLGKRITARELDQHLFDWRSYPPHSLLRDIGTEWVESGASLAMQVPSAVVPNDMNFLLNPAHPDFQKITASSPSPGRMGSAIAETISLSVRELRCRHTRQCRDEGDRVRYLVVRSILA